MQGPVPALATSLSLRELASGLRGLLALLIDRLLVGLIRRVVGVVHPLVWLGRLTPVRIREGLRKGGLQKGFHAPSTPAPRPKRIPRHPDLALADLFHDLAECDP